MYVKLAVHTAESISDIACFNCLAAKKLLAAYLGGMAGGFDGVGSVKGVVREWHVEEVATDDISQGSDPCLQAAKAVVRIRCGIIAGTKCSNIVR